MEQLGGESPERHAIGTVAKPHRRPEERLSQKNKVKIVIDLTGIDGDGRARGGSPSIKPEASDDSTPAKPFATLEPAAGVLVTLNTVTPSTEKTNSITRKAAPMGVTPRPAENKVYPPTQSVSLMVSNIISRKTQL